MRSDVKNFLTQFERTMAWAKTKTISHVHLPFTQELRQNYPEGVSQDSYTGCCIHSGAEHTVQVCALAWQHTDHTGS